MHSIVAVCSTVDCSFQSVKVITELGGREEIVAQWKLRSDGKLELPRSLLGVTYLVVYTSDEERVKIPTAVATGESVVPLYPPGHIYIVS